MEENRTKICTKCGKERLLSEFSKNIKVLSGLRPQCKLCDKDYRELQKKINPQKVIERSRKWHRENPEYGREWHRKNLGYARKYSQKQRRKNPEKTRAYLLKWKKVNPKKVLAYNRKWHKNNPDKWYKENLEKAHLLNAEWRKKNPKRVREYKQEWTRKKLKADPKFKLNWNISGLIRYSLKGNKKGAHWEDLVGYTIEKLKKHLEKQFVNGMTWLNYGEWHLEHKIPISVFNFTKPEHEDFRRCWALENLQPMWASENLSKQAKLSRPFQPSLLL